MINKWRPEFMSTCVLLLLLIGNFFIGCTNSKKTIELPTRGICAHRGAMESFPENTIVAFKEAIRLGVHMIEFDVYRTLDSALVVIHDIKVDRTTNGSGSVSELTLAEIKSLDAGSWKDARFVGEKVPTFDEVLDIMPVNIWLNIHLKDSPETGKEIAQKLLKAGRLHQAFLACDLKTKAAAQAVVPELLVCNMERQSELPEYVQQTIKSNANFIQFFRSSVESVKPTIVDLINHKILTNYCCSDDSPVLKELFSSGVNFVLVNNPAPAMKVAAELGIQPVVPIY